MRAAFALMLGSLSISATACGGRRAASPVTVVPAAPLERATCFDGFVVPRGGRVPEHHAIVGRAVDGPEDRARSIAQGTCSAAASIRACRVDAQATQSSPIVGSMVVELSVGEDGLMKSAKPISSTVNNAALPDCVAKALSGVLFTKDGVGVTTLELSFSSGLRTLEMSESGTRVGGVDEDEVKKKIRATYPQFRACYEQLAKKHGVREGVLTFDAVLRSDGTVASLNVDHTESFNDKEFLQCAANAFVEPGFPKPKEGAGLVHYAISFEAT